MARRAMVGLVVVAMVAMFAACGDDDDNGGNGTANGNGNASANANGGESTGGDIGEATFEVTGDYEFEEMDGESYFQVTDMTAVGSTPDYSFDIYVSESIPIGMETHHLSLRWETDDEGFMPEEGTYDATWRVGQEGEWQAFFHYPDDPDGMLPVEDGTREVTIDSVSSSEIHGSFEIDYAEFIAEEDVEITVSGEFRAEPVPF